jgi:hypothetical protein
MDLLDLSLMFELFLFYVMKGFFLRQLKNGMADKRLSIISSLKFSRQRLEALETLHKLGNIH